MGSGRVVARSPLAGRVLAMSQTPDPVFAEAMVGPGITIDPAGEGTLKVRSPIGGTIAALHPHAFAIEAPGAAVLVHLGLDTVTLKGEPFDVVAQLGAEVKAGEVIVRWRVGEIGALSPLVPVVALGAEAVELLAEPGTDIAAGAELFAIEAGARETG